jgi:hypothetical protein
VLANLPGFLLVLASVTTQLTWEIPGVDVRLAVQPGGAIVVTEIIEVNFGPNERSGIQRELPTTVHHPRAGMLALSVSVRSVTEGSQIPVPHRVTRGDGYLAVDIGHPDSLRVGATIYRLEYEVRGAIVRGMNREYLTWPVVAGEWDAPIFQVEAVVELPREMDAAGVLAASETGHFGDSGRAADIQMADSQRIVYRQMRGLKQHQRLVIHASWPRLDGADGDSRRLGVGGGRVSQLIGFALLAVVLFLLLRQRRRSPGTDAGPSS